MSQEQRDLDYVEAASRRAAARVLLAETRMTLLREALVRNVKRINQTLQFLDQEEGNITDCDEGYVRWLVAEIGEYLTDDNKLL